MLSLSKSLTNHEVYAVFALVAGRQYRLALTHPYDAESAKDASLYKHWLWQQMQQPHSSTYKHLAYLARQHKAGQRVIIRVHQNAHHGEIILAALHYLTDRLPDLPKACPRHNGESAHFSPWLEAKEEDDLLDTRRFVWITGQYNDIAHLGYIWDTDGVLTALVPNYGLVKLGRPGPYWLLRKQKQITQRVRVAAVALSEEIEQVFTKLVEHQRQAETVEHEPNAERYDAWALQPEACLDEPPTVEAQQAEAETTAFLAFYQRDTRSEFYKLLPTAYQGEHVKPVIKTKPDGSRWLLSPEQQARGVLHLYQRI
jgi:hypothetical protein